MIDTTKFSNKGNVGTNLSRKGKTSQADRADH